MKKVIKNKKHPIHVHCFTSSWELCNNLISHFDNLFIGFTGIITFKTAQEVRKIVEKVN